MLMSRFGWLALRAALTSPNGFSPLGNCFDGRSRNGAATMAIYFPAG
jgi:hypothetical protein